MQSVCVFCGSGQGKNPNFAEAARLLGQYLAGQKVRLVYGGGKIGLMGILADSCLSHGGRVTGVIPRFLSGKEIAHEGITELIKVESMHQRKLKMSQLAEGFIALPGGFGTLEELMEILTWVQLGLVNQPVGILNIDGFYDRLFQQFQNMKEEELVKASNLELFVASDNIEDLFKRLIKAKAKKVALKDKFIHT